VVGALSLTAASAATTVLTFEGLQDGESVLNYYNNGTGMLGSGPGGDFGVVFSPNALAYIDLDDGGSGNFGGEPSPSTAIIFLPDDDSKAFVNCAAGFTTGFSVYYSAISSPGVIKVFDGLNGTGNLLASLQLPVTPSSGDPDPTGAFSPLLPAGVSFQGIARSVDFSGSINLAAFDDLTLGTNITDVSAIPEPDSMLWLGGFLASGLLLRNRRQRPAGHARQV
jgi:hypothetical protein